MKNKINIRFTVLVGIPMLIGISQTSEQVSFPNFTSIGAMELIGTTLFGSQIKRYVLASAALSASDKFLLLSNTAID